MKSFHSHRRRMLLALLRQLYNITLYGCAVCRPSYRLPIHQVRFGSRLQCAAPTFPGIAGKFVNRSRRVERKKNELPSCLLLPATLPYCGCVIKLYLNAHIGPKTLITFIILPRSEYNDAQLSDLAGIERHLMGFSLGFVCIASTPV